jgi:GT2 family glycosyltransferase
MTVWTAPQEAWEVELIVGNCVLYPVDAIKQVGLMNEKAFPYGFGDAEYTPRMYKAGWSLLIEPSAYVWCQPNTIPPSMKSLPKRKFLRELFLDRHSQRNLVRMFKTRWYSAPSHFIGLVAFGVTVIRLALKWGGLGGNWPNWPDESGDHTVSKVG